MNKTEFPRLAMLAFTPHADPAQYLVVRPHTGEPDPAQLAAAAAADAAGEPEEATRLLALAHADARNRCTRFTVGPDPDADPPDFFGSTRTFREEPDERVVMECVPVALVHAMGQHGSGALQVWVNALTTGPPCPDERPRWFSMLMPRVELRAWEYHRRHDLLQLFDVEARVYSHHTQHAPYGPLPDNGAGVRCKQLAFVTGDLPEPTGPPDA